MWYSSNIRPPNVVDRYSTGVQQIVYAIYYVRWTMEETLNEDFNQQFQIFLFSLSDFLD